MKATNAVLYAIALGATLNQTAPDATHTNVNAASQTSHQAATDIINRGPSPCEINSSLLPKDIIEHEGIPYGVFIAGDKVLAYCDIVVGTVEEGGNSFALDEDVFNTKENRQVRITYPIFRNGLSKRGSNIRTGTPFANNVLTYFFADTISQDTRALTYQVLNEWSKRTSIQFVETKQAPFNVGILKATGCWTGDISGQRIISLGDGCSVFNAIAHEFGHALGLIHEHQRPDRDKYVKILYENIKPEDQHNFDIVTTASTSFPYDYNSLMHYWGTAFGINGQTTIVRADGSPLNNNFNLQVGDGQAVQEYYKMTAVTLFSDSRFNGDKRTFRFDENNRCVDVWADFNDIASSASWVLASGMSVNEICFYEDSRCSGQYKCWSTSSGPNIFYLDGINDMVSSVGVHSSVSSNSYVSLYPDSNWNGAPTIWTFPPTNDAFSCQDVYSTFNDVASSAKWSIPNNKAISVCLYDDAGCSGFRRCWHPTSNPPSDLSGDGINDRTSSVGIIYRINNDVEVYSDSQYQGNALGLGADGNCYNFNGDWANQVSSTSNSPGKCLTLWQGYNCQGTTTTYSISQPWVGFGWNDIAKSYKVFNC